MSDRDFFQLREMIRKLQQKVTKLEKQLEDNNTQLIDSHDKNQNLSYSTTDTQT